MRLPVKYTHLGYDFIEWAEPQNAWHPGIDFNYGAPEEDLGLSLFPFKSGRVVHVSRSNEGYGNLVVLKHGSNEYSKYAHLKSIDCEVGDIVNTFEKIGELGKSGTRKPHLHFEICNKNIISRGYRFYPSSKSKEFVKQNYKNPFNHIMPTQVSVKIIADGVKWIDKHVDDLIKYFLENSKDQIKLNIDTKHVEVATKIEENSVDMNWFWTKWATETKTDDVVIYCTNNEDWEIVERGGYHKQGKVVGREMIFMHANENSSSRDFADIGHEFKGRFVHEMMHALYAMSGAKIPENWGTHQKGYDNTHYFDYKQKNLKKALKEIDYDSLDLNPFKKQNMSKFKLVKGDNDEDVFAVKSGVKHHIINEYTLNKGVKLGLWKRGWETIKQSEVDAMETGCAFVFSPNK